MKKNLTSFLFVLVCGSAWAQYTGDPWSKVSASKKGMLSLAYVETPGFVYKDNAGNLTGICVDIMKDFTTWLKDEKGIAVQVNYVGDGSSFRGMYDKVKASSGGVIGLGNITITEERKKEIKFSPPFITNFAVLITQNRVGTLVKLEDMSTGFAGLTAYTAKGTLNEKRTDELKSKYFPAMKISYTGSSQETMEKILTDANAFAYLDLAFYLDAVKQRKAIKRHPAGDKAAEQFGFVLPLSSDWGAVLDEFFAADGGYTTSGDYKHILVKHLGETGVRLLSSVR
ncbi:MAG: amino acid ABC transporter substrate-binding protein [Bacteroidia bacterium]|nr:amino acid ABC transporter substrate-binding protein [Bacteroidia bacterium]